MRTIPAFAALLLVVPVFASGPGDAPAPTPAEKVQDPQEWPQKKDTAYISAKLEWMQGPPLSATAYRFKEELPACSPITVYLHKEQPLKIRFVDDMGRAQVLADEGWLLHLHRSPDLCNSYLKEHGQPRIRSRMGVLMPVPEHRIAQSGQTD